MYISDDNRATLFLLDIFNIKLYIVIPDKITVINVKTFNPIMVELKNNDKNIGTYVVIGP